MEQGLFSDSESKKPKLATDTSEDELKITSSANIENFPMNWLRYQIMSGANPRGFLTGLGANMNSLSGIEDDWLWKAILELMTQPEPRKKLPNINTIEHVIHLLSTRKKILVLTGAGISVSCGIPDFRSKGGIYARLSKDFPDLASPTSMFDIHYFTENPKPFFSFAREIYPGRFVPSLTHQFISLLEKRGTLLRNYTQNIDTLEQVAGISRVVQCHGSFATATCRRCGHKQTAGSIEKDIMDQKIPYCPKCPDHLRFNDGGDTKEKDDSSNVSSSEEKEEQTKVDILSLEKLTDDFPHEKSNPITDKICSHENPDSPSTSFDTMLNLSPPSVLPIMKPDIVFFGENLPRDFFNQLEEDKHTCDLLLIIGSSLKVRPVSLIPSEIDPKIPQILINREPLTTSHTRFDVQLLGDCDVIIKYLLMNLHWSNSELMSGSKKKEDSIATEIHPLEELHLSDVIRNNPEIIMKMTSSSNANSLDDGLSPSSSKKDSVEMPLTTNEKTAESTTTDMDSLGKQQVLLETDNRLSGCDEGENKLGASSPSSVSLSSFIPSGKYLFSPPNNYIFPGAEIYSLSQLEEDDDDDEESDESGEDEIGGKGSESTTEVSASQKLVIQKKNPDDAGDKNTND